MLTKLECKDRSWMFSKTHIGRILLCFCPAVTLTTEFRSYFELENVLSVPIEPIPKGERAHLNRSFCVQSRVYDDLCQHLVAYPLHASPGESALKRLPLGSASSWNGASSAVAASVLRHESSSSCVCCTAQWRFFVIELRRASEGSGTVVSADGHCSLDVDASA